LWGWLLSDLSISSCGSSHLCALTWMTFNIMYPSSYTYIVKWDAIFYLRIEIKYLLSISRGAWPRSSQLTSPFHPALIRCANGTESTSFWVKGSERNPIAA
jgi:hypothetical protein